MTIDRFIAGVEGYYGEYERPVLRSLVAQYLRDEYEEEHLFRLFYHVLRHYSGRYHYPPDIAILEQAKDEYNAKTADRIGGKRPPALPEPVDDEELVAIRAEDILRLINAKRLEES